MRTPPKFHLTFISSPTYLKQCLLSFLRLTANPLSSRQQAGGYPAGFFMTFDTIPLKGEEYPP